MSPAERFAAFAFAVEELHALDEFLREHSENVDRCFAEGYFETARRVVFLAPTWEGVVTEAAALGIPPFAGGPEAFEAYMDAVRALLAAAPIQPETVN